MRHRTLRGGLAVGLSALVLAYGSVVALTGVPAVAYVLLNLGLAGALVVGARAWSLSWDDVGLSPRSLGPGLRWGVALAAVVAAGVGIGLLVLGHRFPSEDVEGLGAGGLLVQVLVRVPVGTAVPEETLFRGVLFAVWSRNRSTAIGVVASSVTFGLWHVGATIAQLHSAGHSVSIPPIAAAVAFTAVAGAGLVWVRARTNGIWAGILIHWAANSLVLIAAWLARRAA